MLSQSGYNKPRNYTCNMKRKPKHNTKYLYSDLPDVVYFADTEVKIYFVKLLTLITKVKLLLVIQQLPESHHQSEAGRWPGGTTDITDVLFITSMETKNTPSRSPY